MILKNYYLFRRAMDSNSTSMAIKNTDGTNKTVYFKDNTTASNMNQIVSGQRSIKTGLSAFVGTGNTEPTFDDYNFPDSLSVSSVSLTYSYTIDENGFNTRITITGTANASSTITRIGLYKQIYLTGSTTGEVSNFLLIHSRLEEPIEVVAGQGFKLTFDWNEQ